MPNYYVYKFLNEEDEILYVGKTKNLRNRMERAHFTNNGHLPTNCYIETKKVKIAKVANNDEMSIYERYLINILNPKYNTQINNRTIFNFELPELDWKDYEFSLKVDPKNKEDEKTYSMRDFYREYGLENLAKIIEFNTRKFLIYQSIEIKKSQRKQVACIDPDTLECVDVFNNVDEAGERFRVYPRNIGKAARKGCTCGGFWWLYLDGMIHNNSYLMV
ncbi:nucleotide excision repair endonuclease [Bacillus vallismortis]|uniref:nucleotide excision repair endonuclease n=1 Tax=Bacillus vallismortis TaxID=72361 RepID=UPI0022805BC5|nr:nucleotide excision repair endonuclease [Bacillus vallismortis]MCY7916174.1 nucleotide excision repair endonuclease [Bacillus vallismortis]